MGVQQEGRTGELKSRPPALTRDSSERAHPPPTPPQRTGGWGRITDIHNLLSNAQANKLTHSDCYSSPVPPQGGNLYARTMCPAGGNPLPPSFSGSITLHLPFNGVSNEVLWVTSVFFFPFLLGETPQTGQSFKKPNLSLGPEYPS